jgi:serine/threonine protein kinase/Tfp pilus assembly protein PilF
MVDEKWQKVREVFDSALRHKPEERREFIHQACGEDKLLLAEVESLLSSLDSAESFMETPAVAKVAGVIVAETKRLEPGKCIGHYEIIEQIGAGGMGEVYLAKDKKLDRQVAVKILNENFRGHESNLNRFIQEAKAASALNHPNILVIHEIGESEDVHYIVSEFVRGKTVREIFAEKPLKLSEVLDVSIQIANALCTAHEAHLVHRDIKPENIMIRPDGYVKILDFGLAKLVEQKNKFVLGLEDEAAKLNQSAEGVILGTVNYMSPEQAKGERVNEGTDIFSLGVVIYEMIAGRTPFVSDSASETFANLINQEPLPLSHFAANVPDELQRIVSKMLRKNRDERYQRMKDVLTDLGDLRENLTLDEKLEKAHSSGNGNARARLQASTGDVATARTTSSAEYLVSGINRHKRGAVFVAAIVFVAVAAVAYYFYPRSSGEAIDSVAVLPFVNASADPNAEYLSEGISDGIITSLSRLPNLKVKSLNSVLRSKGQQVDPQAVGRELNVRAVLMGRLTQQGDGLAISAELVDVRDNRRLWGEQYSRKLSDILVVQEEIAREISEGLRLRLTGEEKKQLAKQHTENTEAYLHYSLGRYSSRQMTKEGFEKSIESFEQAVKIDPNYALAYVGLASTYQFMGSRGFSPSKEYEQKVEWAALKALQLDETLAEAHVALGAHKFYNFDWVGAEKEIKRGLELDPNSSQANGAYSIYLRVVGRANEGLPYAIRARELDSMPDRGEAAFDYYMARQYDKAIELYRKNLEQKPDNTHAHILLGEAYVAKGMPAEGVAEMQKGVALDATLGKTPERWDRYPLLAYAYAAAGRRDEALKILDAQQRLAKQRYVSPYNFAIIYTGLGDKDRAFEWLTKCIEQRTLIVFHLKSRPLFDPLRSDPRYRELLRRMNLEP